MGIYSVIDQRIIQLLSSSNVSGNGQTKVSMSSNQSRVSSNGSLANSMQNGVQNYKLSELQSENDKMKKEIHELKIAKDDMLNEKITEMNGLRQQMNEQSKIIIRQKEQMAKQHEQQQNAMQKQKPAVNNQKYTELKKAYDSLRRNHEDLFVYVGHLDEKLKKLQMSETKTRN